MLALLCKICLYLSHAEQESYLLVSRGLHLQQKNYVFLLQKYLSFLSPIAANGWKKYRLLYVRATGLKHMHQDSSRNLSPYL
jgi:hypothetical protein